MTTSPENQRSSSTVIVLGGGFGGLEATIELAKKGVAVTLVSDRKDMFIYPTSIWRVTGEHGPNDDLLDLEQLAKEHGFRFVLGKVSSVDAALRSVRLEKNEELVADYLVIALGAGKAAPKGVENTHTISGTPQDTSKLHDALAELTAKGHGSVAMGFGGNPKDGSAVRGGPLFEVLFNFDLHLRRRNLRDKFQLTFFAPMEKPGLRMGERAAQAVGEFLSRSGIEQRVGKPIESFDKEGVNLKDGGRIQADLVVFVPAGSGHPVLQQSGLPLNEAGFVKIDGACRVLGHSRVYVVGDSAALEGPEWRAKQGHVTVAMAQIAARSILADIRNQEFNEDYRPHVDILCVMDTGNAAALVHRTSAHSWFVNLPIIGHWLKKAWGVWFRWSHRRIFHRPLPS